MRGVRDVLLRGEERGVEIALPELSEEERGTQSRSKLALKTTLKRCKTPSLPFTIPRCFIETGTRGFSRREFGQLCPQNPPPSLLIFLSRLCYYACVCICKTRGNYERGRDIWKFGVGGEDDDRRANFLRGGEGRREAKGRWKWKFIAGQPMLMLRARGKIEIRLHFRESWRVGGSTARAR